MPGIPADPKTRRLRAEFALSELAAGQPYSATVAKVADQWGCSRRQARDVCRKALDVIVEDVDGVDIQGLMARSVERLERIAAKAEEAGQYSAAVGAVGLLGKLIIEPHQQRQG
jgi:hypothetical protein